MSDADPDAPAPLTGAPARRVPKPWGHELIWAQTDRYVGKLIAIEAGQRLSLQLHERKEESVYVLAGLLRLHLEDEAGAMQFVDLGPGDARPRPAAPPPPLRGARAGRAHRGLDSRPRRRVRLEDDFGREGTSAP